MRFQDKTAIVTGAAGGIGRETALRFARESANVAVVDIDPKKLEKVVAEIRKAGGTVLPFVADIAHYDAVRSISDRVIAKFGRIDILVNNAGAGWHHQIPFKDTSPGDWEWILDVNLKGTLYFTHAVLDTMTSRQYGRIINVASIAARAGIPNLAVYAASKGAMVSFTKSLAMELGPSHITVNCVSPGLVAHETEPPRPCGGTFLGRKGRPEEFASVIAFLASDEASFITGADYLVDGGRTLGPRGA